MLMLMPMRMLMPMLMLMRTLMPMLSAKSSSDHNTFTNGNNTNIIITDNSAAFDRYSFINTCYDGKLKGRS